MDSPIKVCPRVSVFLPARQKVWLDILRVFIRDAGVVSLPAREHSELTLWFVETSCPSKSGFAKAGHLRWLRD